MDYYLLLSSEKVKISIFLLDNNKYLKKIEILTL